MVDTEIAAREEYKAKFFDRELRALASQLSETIKSKYSNRFPDDDDIEEELCLKRYMAIYDKMSEDEHYCYFEAFYVRYRKEILNVLNDDVWLRKGEKWIQFGENIPKMREKCKNIKIMLSNIFAMACKLQELSEKSLEGLDESLAKDLVTDDINRPTIILLHLMRIFYILNETSDKEKLGEIVTCLETDLGAVKTVGAEPWLAANKKAQTPASQGLAGILSLATSMMEKFGINVPEGITPINENDISQAITNVFGHEKTQETIQNLFSSLQNCTDVSTAIKTVVDTVSDSTTLQALQESVTRSGIPGAN